MKCPIDTFTLYRLLCYIIDQEWVWGKFDDFRFTEKYISSHDYLNHDIISWFRSLQIYNDEEAVNLLFADLYKEEIELAS